MTKQWNYIEDCNGGNVTLRLRGGGGDGGSTGAESRDAFLKMYMIEGAHKVDVSEERLAKWTCCQISGEPLEPPCVCDELGTLFNKEAIVKAMLEKKLPKSLCHIKSLNHLIPLTLSKKPQNKFEKVTDSRNYMKQDKEVLFQCPLTGLDFNGSFKFYVHQRTGHVVSERALKEVPLAVEGIVKGKVDMSEWLIINGPPETVKELRVSLYEQRSKQKMKKTPKRKILLEKSKDIKEIKSKKLCVVDKYIPADASKDIFKSIFESSKDSGEKSRNETFLCRSVAARGMNLT